MNNKICRRCGTENQPDYIFCKKCGSPIEGDNPPPYSNGQAYGQQGYGQQAFHTETIDGVKINDVAMFVGKSAPKYIPKFERMEITGSSVSPNWLILILSMLVSPLFAAFWFASKRMNKIAITIFTIISALEIAFFYFTVNEYILMFSQLLSSGADITEIVANLPLLISNAPQSNTTVIIGYVYNLTGLVVSAFYGMFANYQYKKHIIKTIKSIKAINEQDYCAQLIKRGGTRNTLWIVLLIVSILSRYIICFALFQTIF